MVAYAREEGGSMKLTKEICDASESNPGDIVSAVKDKPTPWPRPIFWRRWLVSIAFRFNHDGGMSKLCWRLSRVFASEQTHMRLAAYSSGLFMSAVMRGEL
jgi:hypothetical protein